MQKLEGPWGVQIMILNCNFSGYNLQGNTVYADEGANRLVNFQIFFKACIRLTAPTGYISS
jgi:hypothetical protein